MSTPLETPVPPCAEDVFQKGVSVCLIGDIPKHAAETICKSLSEVTGWKIDWHYIGGRTHIKALPPESKDMTADTFLTLTGEITKARRTQATLAEKAIALCDAVENKDDLPLTKYALRAARLVNEVRHLATDLGRTQSGSPTGLDNQQREAGQ